MDKVKMGLWDMKVANGDFTCPNNPFQWSQEFRHMLGFKNEEDFPNRLDSWADRLHPDHKEPTLKAFADSIADASGMTIYDVEYLLQDKAGQYHWFRAAGDVERDADGKPLRIVGSLYDIGPEREASGDKEFRNNGQF